MNAQPKKAGAGPKGPADRETGLLLRLAQIIGKSSDPAHLWQEIAGVVARLVPFERFTGWRLDPRRGAFVEVTRSGNTAEWLPRDAMFPFSPAEISRMFPDDGPIVVGEMIGAQVAERVGSSLEKAGNTIVGNIAAPLVSGGQIIGLLIFGKPAGLDYTPEHVLAAGRIARQLAGPLENGILRLAIQAELSAHSALAKLGRVITRSTELSSLSPEFASTMRELVPADCIVISTFDESRAQSVVRYIDFGDNEPVPGWEDERRHDVAGTIDEEVVRTGQAVAREFESDAELRDHYPGAVSPLQPGQPRSVISVPLVSQRDVFGILTLWSASRAPYTGADLDRAIEVGAQIAGAVAGTELHRRHGQLWEEREHRLRLEAEQKRLSEVHEAKSEFVNTVSHELRTPLASIAAFADILARDREKTLTGRQRQQISVIQRNARRLEALVNDLLDLRRAESGPLALVISEFEIRKFLDEVRNHFQPVLEEKSQSISISCSTAGTVIFADRECLAQLITNLLDNASRYSGEQSEISLRARIDGDRLAVEIEDKGIGIPAAEQAGLFSAFHRRDSDAAQPVDGTGLGLYVSKMIVESHGGEIKIDSQEHEGTTVRLWIPLRGAAQAA